MRLLITRAPEDAAPLVAKLGARGHDCLVQPLHDVAPAELDAAALAAALDGVQALLFTSANGARAFAAQSARRDLPVYAVGDATAAAARAAGFAQVESAGGDVAALAALVAARLSPAAGPLFHAAARQVAGDLQGRLAARGFTLRRLVLYEARPVTRLSDETRDALRGGRIDAALFFSPRSGGTFVRLLSDAGLQGACRSIHALCLSAAVADAVAEVAWAGTTVAARPDSEALLEAVEALAARPAELAADSEEGDGRRVPADDSKAKDQQVDDRQEQSKSQEAAMETPPEEARPSSAEPPAEPPTEPVSEAPAETEAEPPALAVISAFGGIRPMAAKLGIAVSTVQGWRERAVIPPPRHEEILTAASRHGVSLDPALLRASDRPPAAAPTQAKPAGPRGSVPASPGAAPAPATAKPEAEKEEKEKPAEEIEKRAEKEPAARQAPAAAPEPRAARGAGWAFFLLGALVFAAGAAAAVFSEPYWQPLLADLTGAAPAPQPASDQRLAALETKLGDLDARLAQLAAAPTPASVDAAAIEDLKGALDGLSGRLDKLEQAVQAASSAPGGVTEAELTPLRDSIERLGSRVDTLESEAGKQAVDGQQLASISGELSGLEARLSEAEGRLAGLEDSGQKLQAAVDQLASESQAARAASSGSAALALAVGQLRDALRSGAPFAAELKQLRALSRDDPELAVLLDPLAPYADSGAPTLEDLQRSFPAAARAAVAAAQGDEAEGWLGGVLRRISGVISVRPVGEVAGDSAGAIVARAETRLHAGDLGAAVSQLDTLQGRAAEAVRAWRDRAQARLAAERALSQLAAHAIAKLGAGDG